MVYSQVKRRFHRGFKTAATILLLLPVPKEPNQKLPDGIQTNPLELM